MTDKNTFDNFLRPPSVAIIGASSQRGSPRNTIVRNLQRHGFQGRIYPVSPSNAEIEGLKAYKSVAELPEAPDVALVIMPARPYRASSRSAAPRAYAMPSCSAPASRKSKAARRSPIALSKRRGNTTSPY